MQDKTKAGKIQNSAYCAICQIVTLSKKAAALMVRQRKNLYETEKSEEKSPENRKSSIDN
jgi:hypothetical protein